MWISFVVSILGMAALVYWSSSRHDSARTNAPMLSNAPQRHSSWIQARRERKAEDRARAVLDTSQGEMPQSEASVVWIGIMVAGAVLTVTAVSILAYWR